MMVQISVRVSKYGCFSGSRVGDGCKCRLRLFTVKHTKHKDYETKWGIARQGNSLNVKWVGDERRMTMTKEGKDICYYT